MLKYMTKYFDFDRTAVDALKKSASDGEIPSTLEIKAVYTDDSQDSHGDIITRSATEKALPDYREWRNIRYMHQPKAVGLAKHIGTDDGADLEWNEVIIKLVDKDTIHQVQEGVLKGLSVGILFNPFDSNSCEITDDGHWKIKEYMLAEISVVDHPAHPNASVLEQSLSEFEDGVKVSGITPELKSAIRSATTKDELVPLLKSLVIEKEEDMKDENLENVEKEGRDWDKERHMPEDVVEPVEIEDEEEVEAEEEEVEQEEEVEDEVEEIEDEVVEPVEEIEDEDEDEVVEEVEPELEGEVASDEEEIELEVEEEEEEVIEDEEVSEEEEEVLESEQPSENNETEEKAITVNEEDVNERLDRIEAMLVKLLGNGAEGIEAEESETPAATEQEEELELSESAQPSNRKSNMNLSAEVVEEEEEEEKGFTFRKKRTDGQTRIRKTLEKLI